MRKVMIAIGLAAGAALLFGQIPIDTNIVLEEAGHVVGEVYRGPGIETAATYTEHWIQYPTFVTPGPRTLATLNLVPKAITPYSSESEFFAKAAFPKGSKYVKVLAEESPFLPAVQRGGLPGNTFDLFESGNKVGEIFEPARVAGANHYLQHWVLFSNYVYPGPKSLAVLSVVPQSKSRYSDENDFFKRVAFAEGGKYIRVTADEYTDFPRSR
ncbi:MAG: hypothetical protein SFV54_01690 [Bryobacteraceae bacterium]|nr:hypothetical protein [Bryobacteraceae bacterium]